MEEHKSHEIKNWKQIYVLIVFVLAIQIFLYNLITIYFR
jgi:hypothetical protein